MKSSRRTMNSSVKGNKIDKEEREKKRKEQIEAKKQEKEIQFKKLEEYVNESGLSLAFNIIFAELISKQIMPENFFTYTSMRLKQIGKEIEGLKTKEEINVDKNEEEDKKEENNEEPNDDKLFQANKKDEDNVLLTVPPKKKNKEIISLYLLLNIINQIFHYVFQLINDLKYHRNINNIIIY